MFSLGIQPLAGMQEPSDLRCAYRLPAWLAVLSANRSRYRASPVSEPTSPGGEDLPLRSIQ